MVKEGQKKKYASTLYNKSTQNIVFNLLGNVIFFNLISFSNSSPLDQFNPMTKLKFKLKLILGKVARQPLWPHSTQEKFLTFMVLTKLMLLFNLIKLHSLLFTTIY